MTVFRAGSATDVGRVRSNNQDSLLVRDGELFAVADGMGGHQGGEVASALALEVLARDHDEPSTSTLVQAVRSANQAVFDRAASEPELKGMGTTITALADVAGPAGTRLGIVNVGDSRLYRVRDDHLEQLTEDHSLVASLVREGRITAEEAESHPQRNILTRALGIDEAVAVDSWEIDPVPGDRFLICSDGLFNEVDESRLAATLRRFDEPADAARELVRLANEGGGRDNITAVVVDVVSAGDAAAPTAPVAAAAGPITQRHEVVPADPPAGAPADPRDTTEVPAPGGDDGDGGDGARVDEPSSRRFTWRTAVFALALLLLLGVVAGALGWYARNTYFVTLDDEQVVIFRGRPGGFLWFDPTVEERTEITADDLPPAEARRLEGTFDRATLDDAEAYVDNLRRQIEAAAEAEADADDEADDDTTTSTGSGSREPGTGAGGAVGDSGTKPSGGG